MTNQKKSGKKKNEERYASRKGRVLLVNGMNWKWQVTSRLGFIAYSENGDRLQAHAADVKGIDPDAFIEGQWDRNEDGALHPVEVGRWIYDKEINELGYEKMKWPTQFDPSVDPSV
jgi:hypothetical protein